MKYKDIKKIDVKKLAQFKKKSYLCTQFINEKRKKR
jgi:hypothetical protein